MLVLFIDKSVRIIDNYHCDLTHLLFSLNLSLLITICFQVTTMTIMIQLILAFLCLQFYFIAFLIVEDFINTIINYYARL